jgi:hypothetical protein
LNQSKDIEAVSLGLIASEGIAEEISSNPDIAAGMSEAEG